MSAGHVFGKCDDCGCTIAPSDKPIRPPGSAGGLRRDGDRWVRTAEVRCPACFALNAVPLPDGVSPSDVFGTALLTHELERDEQGGAE